MRILAIAAAALLLLLLLLTGREVLGPPDRPADPDALPSVEEPPGLPSARRPIPGDPEAGVDEVEEQADGETLLEEFPFDANSVLFDREDVHLHPSLAGGRVRVRVADSEFGLSKGCFVMVSDLDEGRHEAEVSVVKDGVLVRAKKTVVVGPDGGTLGEVHLVPRAGVKARVVDADGTPVPQAVVTVARPEEEPDRARRIEPDKEGWVTYADLEPGVYHRVVVFGLPDPVERTVRVPPEPTGRAEVEIRMPDRLARVTLRVAKKDGTVPEKVRVEIPGRGGARELPAMPLTADLLPGTYRLTSGEESATVTIPSLEEFEADARLE